MMNPLRGLWLTISVILVLAVACMAFVAPASAQGRLGPSLSSVLILRDGNVERGQAIGAFYEYQTHLDDLGQNWLGIMAQVSGTSEDILAGLGLRYYREVGTIYPGIGIVGSILDVESSPVEEMTFMLGFDVLIELNLTENSAVALRAGAQWPVAGDMGITMVPLAVDIPVGL